MKNLNLFNLKLFENSSMSIIFTLVYSINEEKEIVSFSPLTGEFKDPSIRIARKIGLNKRGTITTKDK